ncbi:hypothetical protein ACKUB1_01990 [Methanospirillum stamsii]|uniref:Uncharacterized protein n=1 Tax=Methanospirillum stamsii TaxID=1277351 RepID=A0A2V2MRP5_9EURY|nr:hypothetical protein [Methanospirillum stamsii]PWR70802.1 hypothetical protein DLD82_15025 [Methanospirillum stamsii]
MGSLFSIRENVEDFSDAFDLICGQLSKSLILAIFSDYERMLEKNQDDHLLILDCESLLTILGEDAKALELLSKIQNNPTFLLPKLRYAAHCGVIGDSSGMNEILQDLLKNPVTSHEKICAFIASARLGDRKSAYELWKELLKESGVQNCVMNADVLDDPDSYTCLSSLFLRERIEAINLLFKLDITENRDIELYFHTSSLHYQIGLLLNPILQAIMYDGEYSAFTGFVVARAVADGAQKTMSRLRDSVTTQDPRVFQELILNLEGIRRYRALYAIGEGLLTFFSSNKKSDRIYIETLIQETGGDIYQLFDMLNIFKNAGLETEVSPLLEILISDVPEIEQKVSDRKNLDSYLGPCPPLTL